MVFADPAAGAAAEKVYRDAISWFQTLRGYCGAFLRWVFVIIMFLVLLPYVLTPVYRYVNPISTPMLARWLTLKPVTRSYVPISSMPVILPRTVLVAEAARFCTHSGVYWQEL